MDWVRLMVLASLLGLSGGCGTDLFGPPPRARTKPALPIDPSETARSVYLIMPGAMTQYHEAWGLAGQREASVDNSIFRAVGPQYGQQAQKSSKLVKESIADGANSIVLVPDDDPELPKALEEAEARKIPVALLGHSLAQKASPNLPPTVVMSSLGPIADRLVGTALDDCKRIKLSTEGTALIIDHHTGDPFEQDRVGAWREALARRGIKKVEVVSCEAKSTDISAKVLEAIKKFPDTFLALCCDDDAMQAAVVARVRSDGKPHFFVAGFVGNWQSSTGGVYQAESGHVELHYENLARIAVRTVLAKAKGQPVPESKLTEPVYYRGEALTTKDVGGIRTPPPPVKPVEGPNNGNK